jgi:hypothetical protein
VNRLGVNLETGTTPTAETGGGARTGNSPAGALIPHTHPPGANPWPSPQEERVGRDIRRHTLDGAGRGCRALVSGPTRRGSARHQLPSCPTTGPVGAMSA